MRYLVGSVYVLALGVAAHACGVEAESRRYGLLVLGVLLDHRADDRRRSDLG